MGNNNYFLASYIRKNIRNQGTIPITVKRIYYGARELVEAQIEKESRDPYTNSGLKITRITHCEDLDFLNHDERARIPIRDGLEEII